MEERERGRERGEIRGDITVPATHSMYTVARPIGRTCVRRTDKQTTPAAKGVPQ